MDEEIQPKGESPECPTAQPHIPYDLHTAALYHWHKIATTLLDTGSDPNARDNEGSTPLHYVARRENTYAENPQERTDGGGDDADFECSKVIDELVKRGGDINISNKTGHTPLHIASMRGNLRVANALLAQPSTQINARDVNYMTPLHWAAYNDKTDVACALLAKGATVISKDALRATPLHYACVKGNVQVARTILDGLRDEEPLLSLALKAQNTQKSAPLHVAIWNSRVEMCELLLQRGADVNAEVRDDKTAMHLAARRGDVPLLKLLIQNAGCVNSMDKYRVTPLFEAIKYQHMDAVQCLVEHGASTTSKSQQTCTPMLLAARKSTGTVMEVLFQYGATIYDCDGTFKNAFHFACLDDNVETLECLIRVSQGDLGEINKLDKDSNTPLHLAASLGHTKCAQCLLENGANACVRNKDDDVALHLSVKNRHLDIVKAIVNLHPALAEIGDGKANTALHLASVSDDAKMIAFLCEAGAYLKAVDISGWSPLHSAAAVGMSAACKQLLVMGTPVDVLDTIERTPMHLATQGGHLEIVQLLLEHGADVKKKTLFKETCLDVAIEFKMENVANLLLSTNDWKQLLRTSKRGFTPMRNLICKMPSVAESVLDKCMTVTRDVTYEMDVTLNYEFLDDTHAPWRESRKVNCIKYALGEVPDYHKHPLVLMVENSPHLLSHEVVSNLLRKKWNTFGWHVYYLNLLLYLLYLTFLTGFFWVSQPPYSYLEKGVENCTAESCSNIQEFCPSSPPQSRTHFAFVTVGQYFLLFLSTVGLVKEGMQFSQDYASYVSGENLCEWFIYVGSILAVVNWTQCQWEIAVREPWQWKLAAFVVLLAWIELVLFIQKLPYFGIYVVMFTQILKTFTRFVPVFFLLVVGFAFSFHMIFANQFRFTSVGRSLLSTGVMMLGEMDYDDLFYGSENLAGGSEEFHVSTVYYTGVAYTIFIAFIIILAVLITNLLIGLAVDDIKSVQREAKQKRLIMRVELALGIERKMPVALRRKLDKLEETLTFKKSHTPHYGSLFSFAVEKRKGRLNKILKRVVLCGSDQLSDQPDVDEMAQLQGDIQELIRHFKRSESELLQSKQQQPQQPNDLTDYQKQLLQRLNELEHLLKISKFNRKSF